MTAQQQARNQASANITPGQGPTEVRLGNQASEYARRNGIPEITKSATATTERNRTDQTDVTKINATLPDGQNWTQNWLERMRGEARIKLPLAGTGMGSAQNASDEARDRYLEKYFATQEASLQTRQQFMGQRRKMETRPQPEESAVVPMEAEYQDESRDEPETTGTPDYTNRPQTRQSQTESDTPQDQVEIASGLSMGQVRKGLMGPVIATASTTGLISLLALSSSDSATTALIRSFTHLIA